MKTANYLILLLGMGMIFSLPQAVSAEPLGSAFTYQGRLVDEDKPADGNCHFIFELWDAEAEGNMIADCNLPDVEVIDGYFTVDLDFGSDAFNGQARWMEIGIVKEQGVNPLDPRQPVNPTPYAIAAVTYVGPGSSGKYLYNDGTNWIARKPVITQQTDNNMQPYQAINFVIALQGVFPSRSGIEPYIGEIMMVGFNFAPRYWAQCDGQLLPISQNTALFSLLGTMYGGDGRTTFGLPDLRGRVPMHKGQGTGLTNRYQGSKGGTETITGTGIN